MSTTTLLAVALTCLAAGYLLRDRYPLLHRHDWYAAATHSPSGLLGTAQAVTHVLYRCRTCPKLREATIGGVFVLSDVTAPIRDAVNCGRKAGH
ncbi:hypothetical protein [Microbispora sp. CA-102843]|uniref:hypothetical protein n=1 Tax=Microbispora sp. CA-102843 TaxID=3239952 RepID=UPI003D8A315A